MALPESQGWSFSPAGEVGVGGLAPILRMRDEQLRVLQ